MKKSLLVILVAASFSVAAEPVRMARTPALSPDGSTLAFEWNGDLWTVPAQGGEARQLTTHAGRDSHPRFSPDGKEVAFLSDREGSSQIFVVPAAGGVPRQLTHHTSGYDQVDWAPGGQALLVKATRDHFWRHGERFFLLSRAERSPEKLVFDDYGTDGQLSPDGKKLLFSREGEAWWRKGYTGSRAAQIWLYDLVHKEFTEVLHKHHSCRWPLWRPDGSGFYYVEDHPQGSNLCEYDFATRQGRQLTRFETDSVVFPAIARDGSAIVFRHLFDLYRYQPGSKELKKLDLRINVDRAAKKKDQRLLTTATSAAFTPDGLEIAFIAGGDLWVMDTELREPKQITRTADQEASPLFTPDGQAILFLAPEGQKHTLWKATRQDGQKFWWQNATFRLERLSEANEPIFNLRLSRDGKKLLYLRGRGDLWTADLDGKNPRKMLPGWNPPEFDLSPDGKWLVYASFDNDFNREVWLTRTDGTGTPFNLSRHPYLEGSPVWSPDGKMVAFAGRRGEEGQTAANVAIVWLRPEDEDRTTRDRKLEKALEKMKARTSPTKKAAGADDKKGESKDLSKSAPAEVVFDLAGLPQRVRRISLGEGAANRLFWSPDSKKLAFTGIFESKAGTFVVEVADNLAIKPLTTTVGTNPVWLKQGNQIAWLVNGIPTTTPGVAAPAPSPTTPDPATSPPVPKKGFAKGPAQATPPASGGGFTFSVRQDLDLSARNGAAFDECWRIMRDHWYDGKMNRRNWDEVRRKYRALAEQAPDVETLTNVIQLMLGELNGSHLGFTPMTADAATPKTAVPRDITAHLGVRFDHGFGGPGLKIRDVLPGGPAEKPRSRLQAGEIIVKIEGIAVGPDVDVTATLNGPPDREIALTVQGADGKERVVPLRPITYLAAQSLLYEQWLRHNRALVEKSSGGKLGYLHISQMSMPTFRKFEEELVSQGAGKDGLVIDVRENPGGSTADHLLTALTQPVHAVTVPRGGGIGYPQDRKVYVTWSKPIVVLCNQNSGSNAEIFSHAIKTLKRGQVVGVQTAGAVVSTGSASILDVGSLRLPTRGWFLLNDGEDMEKNGALPHHVLWSPPSDLPQGRDPQLARAIEVLTADVQEWHKRPRPTPRFSTERP